jgi:hypothetical protein
MILLLAWQALYVGNNACEPCHADIVRSYRQTPMAQSSGRTSGDLVPGTFRHADSGVEYRIHLEGIVEFWKGPARRERTLDYFIGSGAAGRSYLYSRRGFLFEAPVTWYSQKSTWDISPGFESDRASRWNRAIEPSCLYCHASQVRAVGGTQNRYGDPPFAENGVACERCHGPGSLHVQGKGAMINPANLDTGRRDSVCMQCHLSGEARIERAGRRLSDYRAGSLLSDYVSYFVHQESSALKATSHVERLYASRCKRESGDRLWCGTCHDPHRVPSAGERTSWYRSKCLTCHNPDQCQRGDDCTSCHLPRGRVVDGGHGVLTDHSIPRRTPNRARTAPRSWRLDSFSGFAAGDRELGLAYAEVALRTGDARKAAEAQRLLLKAPPDAEVLLKVAYLAQRRGESARAVELYREVLQLDPNSVTAMVNLGTLTGEAGKLGEAVALWREALERNPCLTEAATNLVRAYSATGNATRAREVREAQSFCIFE